MNKRLAFCVTDVFSAGQPGALTLLEQIQGLLAVVGHGRDSHESPPQLQWYSWKDHARSWLTFLKKCLELAHIGAQIPKSNGLMKQELGYVYQRGGSYSELKLSQVKAIQELPALVVTRYLEAERIGEADRFLSETLGHYTNIDVVHFVRRVKSWKPAERPRFQSMIPFSRVEKHYHENRLAHRVISPLDRDIHPNPEGHTGFHSTSYKLQAKFEDELQNTVPAVYLDSRLPIQTYSRNFNSSGIFMEFNQFWVGAKQDWGSDAVRYLKDDPLYHGSLPSKDRVERLIEKVGKPHRMFRNRSDVMFKMDEIRKRRDSYPLDHSSKFYLLKFFSKNSDLIIDPSLENLKLAKKALKQKWYWWKMQSPIRALRSCLGPQDRAYFEHEWRQARKALIKLSGMTYLERRVYLAKLNDEPKMGRYSQTPLIQHNEFWLRSTLQEIVAIEPYLGHRSGISQARELQEDVAGANGGAIPPFVLYSPKDRCLAEVPVDFLREYNYFFDRIDRLRDGCSDHPEVVIDEIFRTHQQLLMAFPELRKMSEFLYETMVKAAIDMIALTWPMASHRPIFEAMKVQIASAFFVPTFLEVMTRLPPFSVQQGQDPAYFFEWCVEWVMHPPTLEVQTDALLLLLNHRVRVGDETWKLMEPTMLALMDSSNDGLQRVACFAYASVLKDQPVSQDASALLSRHLDRCIQTHRFSSIAMIIDKPRCPPLTTSQMTALLETLARPETYPRNQFSAGLWALRSLANKRPVLHQDLLVTFFMTHFEHIVNMDFQAADFMADIADVLESRVPGFRLSEAQTALLVQKWEPENEKLSGLSLYFKNRFQLHSLVGILRRLEGKSVETQIQELNASVDGVPRQMPHSQPGPALQKLLVPHLMKLVDEANLADWKPLIDLIMKVWPDQNTLPTGLKDHMIAGWSKVSPGVLPGAVSGLFSNTKPGEDTVEDFFRDLGSSELP